MLDFIKNLFGSKSERDIKSILPVVEKIKKSYEEIKKLSNDELRNKTAEFKSKINNFIQADQDQIKKLKSEISENPDIELTEKEKIWGEIDRLEENITEKLETILNEILPEAFAVMKDTARRFKENPEIEVTASERDKDLSTSKANVNIQGEKAVYKNTWEAGGNTITWDMIHYDVQLIGGVVLHQGKIAEMATGEGKTLVATLPVYLNALSGRGVHLVTVNDYLAKRDAEWMGMLFEFHGLKVDCVDLHKPNSEERRQAYLADITYGTNNEFGFDYLRDNMATDPEELVQRPHNYSIVDEVDSVLIDEARTPLIISGPTPRGDKQEFDQLKPYVQKLYGLQRKMVTQILAEAKNLIKNSGNDKEKEKEGYKLLFRAYRGLPKNKPLIKFLSEPGVRAGMQKTENFYMAEQNKNMHIIDDELYFVIEEKANSIELTDKGIDVLTEETGDDKFYIMPDIGMEVANLEKSNLSESEIRNKKSEIIRDFSIKSERIHTMNQLMKAYTLFENDVEYVVVDNKIKIVDEQTGRIMEGRRYCEGGICYPNLCHYHSAKLLQNV
jgi:preprotein translocase subunit SecA